MKRLVLFSLCLLLTGPADAVMFPVAGDDVYSDTRMTFKVEIFAPYGPGAGIWIPGELVGPTTIRRSDPYAYTLGGGDEAIDTEIIVLSLTGYVGTYETILGLNTGTPSLGMIIDTNPEPDDSFPAESFFDIYFEITIKPDPENPATWLTVHNNTTHRMESTITEIPPDLDLTPYFQSGGPTALYLPDDTHIGNLKGGIHPEPATLCLFGFGGLLLRRRKSA